MFRLNGLVMFTTKAILSIIGLAFIWTLIASYYNHLLITATNGLLMNNARLASNVGDIYFYSSAGELVMGIHGAALHFSLILLMALLIATPGLRILCRFRNISIGLLAIFIFHLVTLMALTGLAQVDMGTAATSTHTIPVILLSTIGLNLLPPVIWLGLCLRQWRAGWFKNRNLAPETPPLVNAAQ